MQHRLFLLSFIFSFFMFLGCENKKEETVVSKKVEVSGNEVINYIEYCNGRFNMCIYYPSNFAPQPEPSNGDGRTFTNDPDEAEIIVFGSLDTENRGIKEVLDLSKSMLNSPKVEEVPHGFYLTGMEKDTRKIHHEIIVLKEDTANQPNEIHNLVFTYPVDKKRKFRRYWKQISRDFK